MGRLEVRAAVTAYFQNAANPNNSTIPGYIPYVGTVYPARPLIVEETAYEETMNGLLVAASPTGGGAVLVVNIPTDARARKALTGRGAVNDLWDHHIALEVWYSNVGGEGITAQQDYDSIIDQIIYDIRADPTLGAPLVIWSAGEYEPNITHEQSLPKTSGDGLTIFINGVVRFDAQEWLNQGVTPPS